MTSVQVSQQGGAMTRSKSRGDQRATPVSSRVATGAAITRGTTSRKQIPRPDLASVGMEVVDVGSSCSAIAPVPSMAMASQGGLNGSNAPSPASNGPASESAVNQVRPTSWSGSAKTVLAGIAAQMAELVSRMDEAPTAGVSQALPASMSDGAVSAQRLSGSAVRTSRAGRALATVRGGKKRQRVDSGLVEQSSSENEVTSLSGTESEVDGQGSASGEAVRSGSRAEVRPSVRAARTRPSSRQHEASCQASQIARLLKAPSTFDGTAAHLEDWMTAFELYADGIALPERMRVPSACSYLMPATLRQLGLAVAVKRPATFAGLRQFLLAYYFGADQSERYVSEALAAEQKASESLEAYAARLQELIRLANQAAVCVPIALEIQLFIKGLRDKHTKRGMTFMRADDLDRVRNGKQPRLATFEQCVTVARKHEAHDSVRDKSAVVEAAVAASAPAPVLAVATTSKTK